VARDFRYLLPLLPAIEGFVSSAVRLPLGGTTVTSWWRNPEHNRRVGGSPQSQHIFALAIDVAGSAYQRRQIVRTATSLGLVAVDEGSHVHVQAFPAGSLARAGVRFPV